MDLTPDDAKSAARALRRSLAASGIEISHSRALESVAHQLGYADWNTAAARLTAHRAGTGAAVPLLRIQDEQIARRFYVDFLGFAPRWEHRFAPGLPLYLRLQRDATIVDLSEHHGDGTPGTVVWIPVGDVRALRAEVAERPHPRVNPGIDADAPGGPTLEIPDPFGNVLRFCQPTP